MIPYLFQNSQQHEYLNVENNIPQDILYQIKAHLSDISSSVGKSISGQKKCLYELFHIFNNFSPLPYLDFIIDSNFISDCINIVGRASDQINSCYAAAVLCRMACGSPEYLMKITCSEFYEAFNYHLKTYKNEQILYCLITISNLILKDPTLSLMFKKFEINLIIQILPRINTRNNKDEELIRYNFAVLNFLENYSKNNLDQNVWKEIFYSLKFVIKNPIFHELVSTILTNLIVFNNFIIDAFLESGLSQFVFDKMFDYHNLFIFYIYFLFNFPESAKIHLWVPIDAFLTFSAQNDLSLSDIRLIFYVFHNFIIFDSSLCLSEQLIHTAVRFFLDINDFDYVTKKTIVYFLCTYTKISAKPILSQIPVNDFVIAVGDIVEDYHDIDFFQTVISAMNEIFLYFTIETPDELHQIMNSDCIKSIQNLILQDNLDVNDKRFFEFFPLIVKQ